MFDELDYRIEAANQEEFWRRYSRHPFIRIPEVVRELSTQRVLVTEWVDGWTWAEFEARADYAARQRAAEVLFRFAQGSVHRDGVFNGDPHPGNYRFHADGTITFLDFGLVKRWSAGEWERLSPCLDAILARDPEWCVRAMVEVGFLRPDHGLDPQLVFEYVSAPYVPYLQDTFTFTRQFTAEALGKVANIEGPHAEIIRALNMPASFVILDRVGVGCQRAARQARGDRSVARHVWRSTATVVHPRRRSASSKRSGRRRADRGLTALSRLRRRSSR